MFQCVTTPLTHVEIPRPRDATELNNDGMIKLGDVHYQTEPNLSIFRKRFNQRLLQFLFANSFSNWLAVSCFSFQKVWLDVRLCKLHFWWCHVWHHRHVTMLQCWTKFSNVLIHWSIRIILPKITKQCLNLSKLCLEYCDFFFSGRGVHILQLKISYSVYVPKIMTVGWQQTKLLL